jgi:hypothetical protein
VKARVPGYLEARCENAFSQLTEVKSKLGQVVDFKHSRRIAPVSFS